MSQINSPGPRARAREHINIRTIEEPTPEGRLASVVRDEMYRQLDAKRVPDYADFRAALSRFVKIELLMARLDEAKLKPNNDLRVKQLYGELADASL